MLGILGDVAGIGLSVAAPIIKGKEDRANIKKANIKALQNAASAQRASGWFGTQVAAPELETQQGGWGSDLLKGLTAGIGAAKEKAQTLAGIGAALYGMSGAAGAAAPAAVPMGAGAGVGSGWLGDKLSRPPNTDF